MRKFSLAIACLLLAWSRLAAADPTPAAADAFPTGADTPEGAACDFARAFIRNDVTLLLATCIEPFGTPEAERAYHRFLEIMTVQLRLDATHSDPPSPTDLKAIGKCFAARHLLGEKPPAAFGFQDVMFVDVSAILQNGGTQLCRTLVIKNRLGRWRVDPQPEQTPELSGGLDDESPSTQEFSTPTPTPDAK